MCQLTRHHETSRNKLLIFHKSIDKGKDACYNIPIVLVGLLRIKGIPHKDSTADAQ